MKDQLDKDIKFYCVGNSNEDTPDVHNLSTLLQQSATTEPPEPKQRDFYGKTFSVSCQLD